MKPLLLLMLLLMLSCTKPDDCGCGVLIDRTDHPADTVNWWLWEWQDECSGNVQYIPYCKHATRQWQAGDRLCELKNLDQ